MVNLKSCMGDTATFRHYSRITEWTSNTFKFVNFRGDKLKLNH